MALTEGRSVKDGSVEFKEKFVEYTMASVPAWGECLVMEEADHDQLLYNQLP